MPQPHPTATTTVDLEGGSQEGGSQTTEYALIMMVAATIAALALAWARNGAVAGLLSGVLDHVRELFGIG